MRLGGFGVFIVNDLSIICFFHACAQVIFNQNNLPSLLQRNLFSDDEFIGVRAGQPVTHMTSQQ